MKEALIDKQIQERKERIRRGFKKQFPQYEHLQGEELEKALEKEMWDTPISDMKNPPPLSSCQFIVFDVSDKSTEQ